MKVKKHYGRWTASEHQFIRDNYTKLSNDEMASKLQRTRTSIANQRRLLGLDNWDYSVRPKGQPVSRRKSRTINLGITKITFS